MHFFADEPAHARNVPQRFDDGFAEHGFELLLVDFLQHQRHGDNEQRFAFLERLHQGGGGEARDEAYMGAARELEKQLHQHAEHMRQRQHRHQRQPRVALHVVYRELHVGRQSAVRQHHALGRRGRPRGVVDERQLVEVVFAVMHVRRAVAVGVARVESGIQTVERRLCCFVGSVCEREIVDADDGFQAGHLRGADFLDDACAGEQQFGIRVVDQFLDVRADEVGQHADHYAVVHQDGEEADCPVGAVGAADGYLAPGCHAEGVEEHAEACGARCHLAERVVDVFLKITECRFVPVVAHGGIDVREHVPRRGGLLDSTYHVS